MKYSADTQYLVCFAARVEPPETATKPALPRIGAESKRVWQSAYVQRNSFRGGKNSESLLCLLRFSRGGKTAPEL